jgi:hypothetical protein
MPYTALATERGHTELAFATDHWPTMRDFATQESLDRPEAEILVYGSGGLFREFRNGSIVRT